MRLPDYIAIRIKDLTLNEKETSALLKEGLALIRKTRGDPVRYNFHRANEIQRSVSDYLEGRLNNTRFQPYFGRLLEDLRDKERTLTGICHSWETN